MKQINLFGNEFKPDENNKYSSKIEAPIYEPKNQKPHLIELVDKTKTHTLIKQIESSSLDYEEKMFLIDAARRHNVFNYARIAEYYPHCTPEVQRLFEESALIIIDIGDAVALGYANWLNDAQAMKEESLNDD